MNAFTTLCRSAALAVLAGLLACGGVVPAMAAAPKDLKLALPTEPVLTTPIAVSGRNLLAAAEEGNYRLSHDSGKHWTKANTPFTCVFCLGEQSRIGPVSGGVVTFSDGEGHLDAYSLVTNARVGTSYKVPDGREVLRLLGGLALLSSPDTGGATVRNLVTGSTREVAPPTGYRAEQLLSDGSVVLSRATGTTHGWIRISPTGGVTTVYTGSSTTTRLERVSGNLLLFATRSYSATTYCLLTVSTPTSSCRTAPGTEVQAISVSSAGLLVKGARNALRWYPIVGGRILASKPVSDVVLRTGFYTPALSVENSYPVIAQRSATSSLLTRLTSGGKTVTVALDWARRPVDVASLALTPTSILGSYAGHSSYSHAWWRSADRKVGAQHQLSMYGVTATTASGSRWATSQFMGRLDLYDKARRTTSIVGLNDENDTVVRQSGPFLLAAPHCNPPIGGDQSCDPLEVLDQTGRRQVTTAEADDIFGTLAVRSAGGRTFTVRDFLDATAPVVNIVMPDPGDGSYANVMIWGDWISATKRPGEYWADSVVAHNYRTGRTLTAPGHGGLQALGDGFAVYEDYASSQIRVWNFETGKVTVLASTGTAHTDPVATDGSRVAFVKDGSLVVKTVAGGGKSAPRVLGVVAPRALKGTWKAAIDLTKPVGSGRLEIRSAAGKVVRSLTVKATKDGSIRDISWNGRDKGGKRVAAGSYTYSLTNRAADGTGAVRLVNGSLGPIGTITVP